MEGAEMGTAQGLSAWQEIGFGVIMLTLGLLLECYIDVWRERRREKRDRRSRFIGYTGESGKSQPGGSEWASGARTGTGGYRGKWVRCQ